MSTPKLGKKGSAQKLVAKATQLRKKLREELVQQLLSALERAQK